MKFDNTYARMLVGSYAPVISDKIPDPRLVAYNSDLALDLNIEIPQNARGNIFSAQEIPEGAYPIALAYAGHQFGSFSPQLGDGRAMLLGEVTRKDGARFDIQLKGSGPTIFSRNGDGKSTLASVLREYIISEALHALDIPTTRALAIVTTGERILRDTPRPGAIFTRVSSSHIRIGSFQYHAARGQKEQLKLLADYTIARHYPDCQNCDNIYLCLLKQVAKNYAYLVSRWMGIGFIHGVMNTDNAAISGETIDYGPCAFMDHYHPETVFSSIDTQGRYAYENQPLAARWNLARFAETLLYLIADDQKRALELANIVINDFSDIYYRFWLAEFRRKFGLSKRDKDDDSLIKDFLILLEKAQGDFTRSFRALADLIKGNKDPLCCHILHAQDAEKWIERYKKRIQSETGDIIGRIERANPLCIPRNHIVEDVIKQAEHNGDFTAFYEFLKIVTAPFESHENAVEYTMPPAEIDPHYKTFCGT